MAEKIDVRPSFCAALRAARKCGRVAVIPDLKVRSPKEGELLRSRDPVDLALRFQAAGASALSVVTEAETFGGSLELLAQVAERVQLPVLRKDFIRDQKDLQETVEAGASAVLLIVAHLSRDELADLHQGAHDLGLETLIEVHTEAELETVLDLGLKLDTLGVNNRDIVRFETDSGTVATTERLARLIPEGTLLVSESGIGSADDVRRAALAGATAVLVGTALLQATEPTELLHAFQMALQKV